MGNHTPRPAEEDQIVQLAARVTALEQTVAQLVAVTEQLSTLVEQLFTAHGEAQHRETQLVARLRQRLQDVRQRLLRRPLP